MLPLGGSTAMSFAVEFATPLYPDAAACVDAAKLFTLVRGEGPQARRADARVIASPGFGGGGAPEKVQRLAPGFYLGVSPGVASLRYVGPEHDPLPRYLHPHDGTKRDEITEWSASSRRRMIRAIAELDLERWLAGPGDAVLMTLTLPSDWLAVAPNGRAFKRHVRAFWARWERDIGRVRCIWKLEFQDRGAPHLHTLVKAPPTVGGETFEQWACRTWADVVGAKGRDRRLHGVKGVDIAEGYTMTDPRRVAVYFSKHSAKGGASKEYQHRVPAEWRERGKGPGRFWGYRGLTRACTLVPMSRDDFYRTRRILLHIARGDQARVILENARRQGVRGFDMVPARRKRRQSAGGAWVLVKDGPRIALTLAEALTRSDQPRGPGQLRRI